MRSCNRCCSRKSTSITHSEYVYVDNLLECAVYTQQNVISCNLLQLTGYSCNKLQLITVCCVQTAHSNRLYIHTTGRKQPNSCVCRHRYPACSAHAPYYIVTCVLPHCTSLFPHYLIPDTIS